MTRGPWRRVGKNVGTALISGVEAILVDLPTVRAHRLAMPVTSVQTLVIARARCSDGVEGIDEATTIGALSYREETTMELETSQAVAAARGRSIISLGTPATGCGSAKSKLIVANGRSTPFSRSSAGSV